MSVPVAWTCPPEYFGDGFSCDCNCGAIDPDCSIEGAPVFHCALQQTCSAEGLCIGGRPDIPIDPAWNCSDDYWNALDGCDCDCGARDPDCDDPSSKLYNCDASFQVCGPHGECLNFTHSPTSSPHGPILTFFPTSSPTGPIPGWTCPAQYYNDGYSCDCNCGLVDPDCAIEGAPVYHCGLLQTCSAEGTCIGGVENIPVDPNWDCPDSYWNALDGCDCDCGARDPDCDRIGTLWNCDASFQVCGPDGACLNFTNAPTSSPHGPQITRFPTISPDEGLDRGELVIVAIVAIASGMLAILTLFICFRPAMPADLKDAETIEMENKIDAYEKKTKAEAAVVAPTTTL